jgi:MFS transporter, DHA3 family, macrolide efflux protein
MRKPRSAVGSRGSPPGTRIAPETGLAPALAETAALERQVLLGARGTGLASPALAPLHVGVFEPEMEAASDANGAAMAAALTGSATAGAPPVAVPRPSPETMARVRQHPYVRLALNGSFSALWAGQLISLFGDRIHQIALAAAVLIITESVAASALVFVAATLPNLVLGPVAGTLVDRWDNKEVLVVSDLLRAATVLLIPIAIVTNVWLVYPLVFLITTISIFFRPARVAILPRIVREDELLSANSALWVGETLADIVGYPMAGLFVVALGAALPVAFWLDAATYVASAALLSTIVVGSVGMRGVVVAEAGAEAGAADAHGDASAPAATDAVDTPDAPAAPAREGFLGELKDGWQFLREEPALLANTVQATIAQLSVGILIALMPAFAKDVFGTDPLGWNAIYSFIETSQGIGSLVGGFVVGLIGIRFAKGRMIILGYGVFGFMTVLFAMSGDLVPVLGLSLAIGLANMVFLIPSQTLFQERTPPHLMGRVVSFRFAMVFGAMTLAMGFGGVLADMVGVTAVMALSGIIAMAAGLAGLLFPAVRDV